MIALDQAVERGEPIRLDLVGVLRRAGDPPRPDEESGSNPRARAAAGFRNDVQSVGVDDERLAGAQHRIQRGARPGRAPEPRTDGNDIGALGRLSQGSPRP